MSEKPSGKFTGRHMAIIIVSFFTVVIVVNLIMARFAVSTFGGTVVDNSYVASQKFNDWLAVAEAQEKAGWEQDTTLDNKRRVVIDLMRKDQPVHGAVLTVMAEHPLGLADTLTLNMIQMSETQWRSVKSIPSGRWIIHVTAQDNGTEARFRSELQ